MAMNREECDVLGQGVWRCLTAIYVLRVGLCYAENGV